MKSKGIKFLAILLASTLLLSVAPITAFGGGDGVKGLYLYIADVQTPARFTVLPEEISGDLVFTSQNGDTLRFSTSGMVVRDEELFGSTDVLTEDMEPTEHGIYIKNPGYYTLTEYPELSNGYVIVSAGYRRYSNTKDVEITTPFIDIPQFNGYFGIDDLVLLVDKLDNGEREAPVMPEPSYVYPADPGADVFPPTELLESISTPEDAAKVVGDYASTLTEVQKTSPTGEDRLERFAEEAASMAASETVTDQFVVDYALVSSLEQRAASAKTAVTNALVSNGVPLNRDIRSVVRVKVMESTAYQPVTTLISLGAFRLNAPASASNVTFNINESYSNAGADLVIIDTAGADLYISKGKVETGTMSVSSPSSTTAKVDFGEAKNSVVTVSFPGQGKATDYYSVTDEAGVNHGGIYDPASDSFKVKVNSSNTFKVAPSEKDFTDLKAQDNEVQKAIKALASKGVINGRTATEFEPTARITRAEIATLLVLALKQMDPNANGNFADVKNSDWFFGAAGSSKKQGLITGYEDNTFRGGVNLPKSQIYSVSARILRNEMKYATPKDINASLKGFNDATSIPDWAKSDVALAAYAGLVTTRTDGKFGSEEEMTRGNAAIAVWRLYNKIF
ncbi:MAG: S-layer homology domain-containing protein [Clostridiales bacterium]|nr:S-layer homology domain-containing protein [Clostridiales bacterium]